MLKTIIAIGCAMHSGDKIPNNNQSVQGLCWWVWHWNDVIFCYGIGQKTLKKKFAWAVSMIVAVAVAAV